jgi:hypothetical protein
MKKKSILLFAMFFLVAIMTNGCEKIKTMFEEKKKEETAVEELEKKEEIPAKSMAEPEEAPMAEPEEAPMAEPEEETKE